MFAAWQKVLSAIVVLVLVVLVVLTQCSGARSPADQDRISARIQLMTSLPLVWGENASVEAILADRSEPSPLYRYWQERYDIAAVDSLENLAQEDPDILILAQPGPMAPADLADLDTWVRAGGNVIILTDPKLAWPSELPLGDPRRPLATGLLSPLLGHWGLELVGVEQENDGDVNMRIGKHLLATRGTGLFAPLAAGENAAPMCRLSAKDVLARCAIGSGRASLVADADFLDARFWPEESMRDPGKSAAGRFIDTLVQTHLKAQGETQ